MSTRRASLAILPLLILLRAGRAQTIPEQIEAILSGVSSNDWSALVEDEPGSVVCYQRAPDLGLAPASNTKMFTTGAAFGLLGTNYSFETRIYGDGALSDGFLAGNLNLVCEHDPTWNNSVFTNSRAPLDHIAAQLRALGLTAIASNVQCYGACAYNLGSTDSLSARATSSRNAAAAAAFVAALHGHGIAVGGAPEGQTNFTCPGRLLYTHHSSDLAYQGRSLRLEVACIPLLKVSHNVMADLLCRHLGWKLGGDDSYGAGAPLVLRWLHDSAGLNTNGMVMNDGSGLSRGNRFSARQCVALLRYLLSRFPSWETALPIGCVDGTIRRRFCGTDGQNQVHAKTGSLRTAIALSGRLINPYDQRRYLFSFLANRPAIDQSATRQAIDDAVVRFAAPVLIRPDVSRSGDSLIFAWAANAGQTYRLQFKESLAAPGWQNLGPELIATNSIVLTSDSTLGAAPQRFYRIVAVH